jgi:hypothetical protein
MIEWNTVKISLTLRWFLQLKPNKKDKDECTFVMSQFLNNYKKHESNRKDFKLLIRKVWNKKSIKSIIEFSNNIFLDKTKSSLVVDNFDCVIREKLFLADRHLKGSQIILIFQSVHSCSQWLFIRFGESIQLEQTLNVELKTLLCKNRKKN